MAFSIKYVPLVKVNIHHLYFLNKGITAYSSMSETERAIQLDMYDIRSFLIVNPTLETGQVLNGHNLVLKMSNSGFSVWSKVTGDDNNTPFISLNDELSFTFLIQIKDPVFYNYTGLDMKNAGKLFYLSNRRLATEPNSFPLINKAGGNFNVGEDYLLSEDGEKDELEQLTASEKMNLFGLIRIFIKGETGSLHITDNQGKIAVPPQTFELIFKNRMTTWRYLFAVNQQVTGGDDVKKEDGNSKILITKAEQPLTRNGFVSIELGGAELPNPGVQLVNPDILNNKYYSEIHM